MDALYEEFKSAAKALNLLGEGAFMLVTSRRRDIFPSVLTLLPIAPLELEDSILFVNTALNLDDSHNDIIRELCGYLGKYKHLLIELTVQLSKGSLCF